MKINSRRQAGSTGLHFPALSLGAGPIGNLMKVMPDAEVGPTVDTAMHRGLRYFDTSPFYGAGLSEHRLGAALRGHARDSFILSSKVGRLLAPGNPSRTAGVFVDTLPFTPVFDYTHAGAVRSFEDSLQRLGVDRIDVLYLHDLSPLMQGADLDRRVDEALRGAYPALRELRDCGTVGAIGLAVSDWRICLRMVERGAPFDLFLLACRYTLLDQEPLDQFLPYCASNGVGVVAAAPFVSGILASGVGPAATYFYSDVPADIRDKVGRIEVVCARNGVPLAAAAMQMPYGHPAVVSVLVGCRSSAEVQSNADNFEFDIPPAFWGELVDEGLIDRRTPFSGTSHV